MKKRRRPTTTFRWWLRLQLGLLLAGGVTWLIGAVIEEDFVTGAGAGMLVGALALRLGRRAAKDSPHRAEDGDGPPRGAEDPSTSSDAPPAPGPPSAPEAGGEAP